MDGWMDGWMGRVYMEGNKVDVRRLLKGRRGEKRRGKGVTVLINLII